MSELRPCKHMFSNGTEYEVFLESQCFDGCTRFRNGKCRVFNALEDARFDETRFPYGDLLEYKGYAGKVCRRYTTEKPMRKRCGKPIPGQLCFEVSE